MGDLIDTNGVDDNPRCQGVKKGIIFINLIFTPISFFSY